MVFDIKTVRPFAQPRLRAAVALALTLAVTAACGKPAPPLGQVSARAPGETRPNILVITVDHLGPELGAYGDPAAVTPNIDRLAREGVRFVNAYAASGGEDAETAALLTGVHPSTIGVVQEWTASLPQWTVAPPPEVKAWPEALRARGYYTFHVGVRRDPFGSPASLWDDDETQAGRIWPRGAIAQPFAGMIDLSALAGPEATPAQRTLFDRLAFWRRAGHPAEERSVVDARRISVPPYLPDTPETRAALKAEYDRDHRIDDEVGAILSRLEKAGLLNSTVVIFTAKTGPARPRAERTVYDAGVHVPLIARWPDLRGHGGVRRDLVSGVDLAPSVLRLAGAPAFAWMQGRDRLTDASAPARFAFTVQDRIDAVYERAFAVRDGRFLYVLDLAPQTPLSALMRPGPLTDALTAARKAGRLTPAQAQLFSDQRPEAELYDLSTDPGAQHDLARDQAHAGDLKRLAEALNGFATSAPDMTVATSQDLLDSYKPGGVTPVTAAPTAAMQAGRVALSTATPGAAILWRLSDKGGWRLYTAPIAMGQATSLQARAIRYGFVESPRTALPATR